MKKTLNNIFDEANASELEKLVSQNVASDVSADTLSSIKNKVYAKTGITQTKTKTSFAFRWQSYVAIAACLLLIVGGIFGAPSIMKLFNNVEPSIVDNVLPTDIDKIIWAANGQSNEDPDDTNALVTWNGWSVSYSLYEVLNRVDKTDFIAIVVSKNNSAELDSFEYKGTTLVQLRAERDELDLLSDKLIDFHKEGEWLKYGELLYTTGTPDGEKWAKSLYDERVTFYGEDFIEKYIVDGNVQTDLLNENYATCQERFSEIAEEIDALIKAYGESYVDEVEDIFVSAGACTVVRNNTVFLFEQKENLANLKVDNKENYMLSLARRSAFDGSSNTNTPTVDNTVTGFDLNKIGLSNVDGCRTGAITNEENLYVALNDLISHWENLMITIGSDNHIDQSELEEMNYSEVQHWNYPTRTVVFVNRNNLNTEALKELTLREDVSFVWVSEQLVATEDNADAGPTPDGD